MAIALCAVGIYRVGVTTTFAIVAIYALVDNALSHGQLEWHYLRLQLSTMLIFVGLVGVGPPLYGQLVATTG